MGNGQMIELVGGPHDGKRFRCTPGLPEFRVPVIDPVDFIDPGVHACTYIAHDCYRKRIRGILTRCGVAYYDYVGRGA